MSKIQGIILLDGADAVGKSTLAAKLVTVAHKLGAMPIIHHLGKPEPGTCWKEHSDALLKYVDEAFNRGKLVIADRHFMSEAVYGLTYRQGSEYPFAARHIDRLLHRFRALRVVCAPDPAWVESKHQEMRELRHEEYSDGMRQVAAHYLNLWNGAKVHSAGTARHYYQPEADYVQQLTYYGGVNDRLGWYHYDVSGEQGKDLDVYARWLLHELETEQELIPEELLDPQAWWFTGFPSPRSILLVGDRLSADNPLHVPFFANHNCSLYLAQTLHALRADESKVVIANINDPAGERTVRELASMCGRVVALGREAEKSLMRQGIKFDTSVRHPQHARRFSYYNDTYQREMRAAFDGFAGVNPHAH